jgi:hypothetical protein
MEISVPARTENDEPGSSPTAAPAPDQDSLDHDKNGKKGGSAPVPAVQHVVVVQADPERGLSHGRVIAVSDADAKHLLASDHVRVASDIEVELAQPFVLPWTA